MAQFGYWTFNRENGLTGAPSTVFTLPDGRTTIAKDPEFPAVLEDEFIIFALKNSRLARIQYNNLYPTLDSVSQARLTALLYQYGSLRKSLQTPFFVPSEQDLSDQIQKNQVIAGVHLQKPTPTIVGTSVAKPIAISGFTWINTTRPLADSSTLQGWSVVNLDETLGDSKRLIFYSTYVEANILPFLREEGDQYIIGVLWPGADLRYSPSMLTLAGFDFAHVWEYADTTSHTHTFYRRGQAYNPTIVGSLSSTPYDFGVEIYGADAWLIRATGGNISTESSPAAGGVFTATYQAEGYSESLPLLVSIAAVDTQASFSTDDLTEIDTPP
jgi:hypothetical protein